MEKRIKKVSHYLVLLALVLTVGCNKKKEAPAPTDTKVEKVVDKKAPTKTALAVVDWKDDKGIGPITEDVKLAALDDLKAEAGKKVYKAKCTACHKLKKAYIGPGLKGVTVRRRPEWILNMIMNPVEMVAKNAAAQALLKKYNAPMADQSISKDDAFALLEYFRRVDSKE